MIRLDIIKIVISYCIRPGKGVILNWKMPGQNGVEITRQIRDFCGEIMPILIISAYDWSDAEREALNVGVIGFLPIVARIL